MPRVDRQPVSRNTGPAAVRELQLQLAAIQDLSVLVAENRQQQLARSSALNGFQSMSKKLRARRRSVGQHLTPPRIRRPC